MRQARIFCFLGRVTVSTHSTHSYVGSLVGAGELLCIILLQTDHCHMQLHFQGVAFRKAPLKLRFWRTDAVSSHFRGGCSALAKFTYLLTHYLLTSYLLTYLLITYQLTYILLTNLLIYLLTYLLIPQPQAMSPHP